MKRFTLLIIICVLLLTSCKTVNTGVILEDGFLDNVTGIKYTDCHYGVWPVTAGDLYAKSGSFKLNEIYFEDPKNFLSYYSGYTYTIYRNEELPDFTVELFDPVAAHLYLDGMKQYTTAWGAELKYLDQSEGNIEGHQDDSDVTYAVRDTIVSGERIGGAPEVELDDDYTVYIELLSAKYPGLYYTVVFYRDIDGKNYLYDYGRQDAYECPQIVVERLWGGA